MTTQIIPNGGSRTSQDLYVGVPQEVTVDTSNQELRLADGATPGGKRIPNLDTIDARYQKKNPELDGLVFDPNQKGFLARVAAGVFRLRTIQTDGNIVIANASGIAGDPIYSLAQTLEGDREIDGDFIVTGVAQIDGGLNGNTAGTHTGPTIGLHTGDVDVRGHTLHLDDGQIAQAAIAGLATALAALVTPVGAIMMWGGTLETIPTHWHLCDGTNGTPDLRSRFVYGASVTADVNTTGGATSHTHMVTSEAAGTHSHGITVSAFQLLPMHMPSHIHGSGVVDNNSPSDVFNHTTRAANPTTTSGVASINDLNSSSHPIGVLEAMTDSAGGDTAHAHGASSDSQGSHVHVIDTATASNLPPFYMLAYIMKIS